MSPDTVLVPQPTLGDFPEFVSIPIRVARQRPSLSREGAR